MAFNRCFVHFPEPSLSFIPFSFYAVAIPGLCLYCFGFSAINVVSSGQEKWRWHRLRWRERCLWEWGGIGNGQGGVRGGIGVETEDLEAEVEEVTPNAGRGGREREGREISQVFKNRHITLSYVQKINTDNYF